MKPSEPTRKREADVEHDEQVAKKVAKPSSEEQPQVQRLQTRLDAEQERAVSQVYPCYACTFNSIINHIIYFSSLFLESGRG